MKSMTFIALALALFFTLPSSAASVPKCSLGVTVPVITINGMPNHPEDPWNEVGFQVRTYLRSLGYNVALVPKDSKVLLRYDYVMHTYVTCFHNMMVGTCTTLVDFWDPQTGALVYRSQPAVSPTPALAFGNLHPPKCK